VGFFLARPPSALAWLNISLHVVGLGMAAAYIQPGSPLVSIAERRAYLAAWPPGWIAAWLVWAGCAGAMVAFTAAVARQVDVRLARWAAEFAVLAAAVDLTCDGLFIARFPRMAAEASTDDFLHRERLTTFVSLFVANGLYSVSTLLLSLALRNRPGIGRAVVPVGVGVVVCGIALAAAGVTGVAEHAFWATGPTIGLYCVWVLLVSRSLTARGCGP
jgi:hypothetical protein